MTMTSTTPDKTICVFCGSSFGTKKLFAEEAIKLGKLIAQKKWGIVYGGGTTGLMGAVANGCATSGGYVHGIIPDALVSKERDETDTEKLNEKLKESVDNHNGTTPVPDVEQYGKTTIVKDMHTRKKMMGQEADAFVALPGGYGTLEELMEVITWFQLSIHNKPIIIFNMDGFYDGLLSFIKDSIDNGFISKANGDIIVVAQTASEVLEKIESFKIPEGRFKLNWEQS